MALGGSLCEALATGQAWLPDEAKLRRLATVSKVPTIVDDAERFLERRASRASSSAAAEFVGGDATIDFSEARFGFSSLNPRH